MRVAEYQVRGHGTLCWVFLSFLFFSFDMQLLGLFKPVDCVGSACSH